MKKRCCSKVEVERLIKDRNKELQRANNLDSENAMLRGMVSARDQDIEMLLELLVWRSSR